MKTNQYFFKMSGVLLLSFKLILKTKTLWISLVFGIITLSISFYSNVDNIEIIKFIASKITAILSGLVGFFITSLVLLLSLNLDDVLYNKEDSSPSYITLALAWYTLCTTISLITLFLSFIVEIIIKFNIETVILLAEFTNSMTLFLLSTLSFLSLFSAYNIIESVYNLGRTMILLKEKEISDKE